MYITLGKTKFAEPVRLLVTHFRGLPPCPVSDHEYCQNDLRAYSVCVALQLTIYTSEIYRPIPRSCPSFENGVPPNASVTLGPSGA